jgi:AcrR family transcriptional regulator
VNASSGEGGISVAERARRGPGERIGRVLDAMEHRARGSGIRAVVMSDLARELGMSTKTLYRDFPSKDAMVQALVERWSNRFLAAQDRRLATPMSDLERVRLAVHHSVRWRSRFCDDFWHDLREDHPDAWHRYVAMVEEGQRRAAEWMGAAVRPGVDPVFARALLVAAVERALRPEVRRGAGLSRNAAVDAAVEIWAHGALDQPG